MGTVGDRDKFDGDGWGWGQIPVPMQLSASPLLADWPRASAHRSQLTFDICARSCIQPVV